MLVFSLVAKDNTSAKDSMRGAFLFALFFFHSFHLASSSIGFFFFFISPFYLRPSTLRARTHRSPATPPYTNNAQNGFRPVHEDGRQARGLRASLPVSRVSIDGMRREEKERGRKRAKVAIETFTLLFFSTPTKSFFCLFLSSFLSLSLLLSPCASPLPNAARAVSDSCCAI